MTLFNDEALRVIPSVNYSHLRDTAARRIPRDPNDWAPIALALHLGAGILTNDCDFLGCGCPTWTFQTLHEELG
ncbi:MAG TPA: PIN domain-containing protein [Thermomicrobiales bacterium]|nr:PIN domain-containing protein [Thermomicrobiales bacterium]